MSVNKVILIGRLGNDPELRFTGNGTPVTNFSIATTEKWGKEDSQEKTEWHRIVAWNKLAEICGEYLKKGQQVYIEGRLQTRKWEDSKSGETKTITEIVAIQMQMLGKNDPGRGSNK